MKRFKSKTYTSNGLLGKTSWSIKIKKKKTNKKKRMVRAKRVVNHFGM